jgi:hypothetical protein
MEVNKGEDCRPNSEQQQNYNLVFIKLHLLNYNDREGGLHLIDHPSDIIQIYKTFHILFFIFTLPCTNNNNKNIIPTIGIII